MKPQIQTVGREAVQVMIPVLGGVVRAFDRPDRRTGFRGQGFTYALIVRRASSLNAKVP